MFLTMRISFNKISKYFFCTAGIVTAAGALPAMISPVNGIHLVTNLAYFDQSPQIMPVVGHWGIMVFGMGILLFFSGIYPKLRKSTIIFSTLEKAYMVGIILYSFFAHKPYATNYIIAVVGDSLMVFGGIWYLIRSNQLKQD
jgi:hypothetical protein